MNHCSDHLQTRFPFKVKHHRITTHVANISYFARALTFTLNLPWKQHLETNDTPIPKNYLNPEIHKEANELVYRPTNLYRIYTIIPEQKSKWETPRLSFKSTKYSQSQICGFALCITCFRELFLSKIRNLMGSSEP